VRLEGLGQLKNPKTSSGIEPTREIQGKERIKIEEEERRKKQEKQRDHFLKCYLALIASVCTYKIFPIRCLSFTVKYCGSPNIK
jgi:hypothetical protein